MNQQSALDDLGFATPVLSAGGSQVKISAQGIEVITGGKFEAKAGQHQFLGGEKVDVLRTFLPDIRVDSHHRNFKAINATTNEVIAGIPYSILNKRTGLKIYGYTDDEGLTKTIHTPEPDELEVKWFDQEDMTHGG
ncbi:hypothetical protein [Alkanindiges illinoisensis]|uniref:hypothetical protein n=1 Tax=Alkanindiges illinoisensis TaxID=197183 RepID=UPI00196B9974|nr:hypothetical protein [Alkanindiges illinoisensis]